MAPAVLAHSLLPVCRIVTEIQEAADPERGAGMAVAHLLPAVAVAHREVRAAA